MWLLLAILSAVFAALTSILAKVGIEGVNSHLATAIRTAVVLVMSWGMVFLTGVQGDRSDQQKELAVSDPVRPGNRGVLAVLLQRAADGGGVQGRAHRQVERCDHAGAGLCIFT